jgi:NADPH2:quinone reductase
VVVIDVEAAGVSFPEVLQSRGEYQLKPDLPFIPGARSPARCAARRTGAVCSRATGSRRCPCSAGSRRSPSRPEFLTFPLADELDVAQGAGLILNYHTAYFSLVTRGRLQEGETVLVHGAAGGVGTATLQVAKGLGARTFAVVSDDEKEEVARRAGADEVVPLRRPWKDEVREAAAPTWCIDPVGGDRMTDSLRSLTRRGGWWSSASPAARSPR